MGCVEDHTIAASFFLLTHIGSGPGATDFDAFTGIACATAATVRAQTKDEAIYRELETILNMGTFNNCYYSDIDDVNKLVGCGNIMIHTQKYDQLNDEFIIVTISDLN